MKQTQLVSWEVGLRVVCGLGVLGALGGSPLAACSEPSEPPAGEVVGGEVSPGLNDLGAIFAESRAALLEVLKAGQAEGADALPLIARGGAMVREAVKKPLDVGGAPVDFDALSVPTAEPGVKEAARKAVAALEAEGVGALMAEVTRSPRAVPEIEADLLLKMKLPQLADIRGLTRLTAARAALALERGDRGAFVERVQEMLALSAHAGHQPGAISGLVGVAVRSRALESIRRGVLTGTLDEPTLAALAAKLEAAPLMSAAKILATEEVLTENVIEYVYFAGPEGLAAVQGFGVEEGPTPRPAKRVIADGVALGEGFPDRAGQLRLMRSYYARMRGMVGMSAAERGWRWEKPRV